MNPLPFLLKFVQAIGANRPKEDEPLNILLVDDSADDLQIIGGILKDLHQAHDPINNLQQAKAVLRLAHYDGVLLDIKFRNGSGQNGIEFCEEVRQTHKDLPVIFISGALHHADVPTLPRGMIQLIIKPDKYGETYLAVEHAVMIFAMHKARQIALNARLGSISLSLIVSHALVWLLGRFWPQLEQLIEQFSEHLSQQIK